MKLPLLLQKKVMKACLLSDDNDDVWNRKLDTYYWLKKKLEEEGIIEKE